MSYFRCIAAYMDEIQFHYWVYGNLVGGVPTRLKNMKVNWDDDIPNIWKTIKVMFQSPPTSNILAQDFQENHHRSCRSNTSKDLI